jgi:phosphate transport system permease protein
MEYTPTTEQPNPQIIPPVVPPSSEIPKRFQPSRTTLLIDRFMTHFIKIGGVSIIAAVFAIFIFIFWQILPLFRGARVNETKSLSVPAKQYTEMGTDEWSEYPFLVGSDGSLTFIDLVGNRKAEPVFPKFAEAKQFTAFRYNPEAQEMIYGTSDGSFSFVTPGYQSGYQNGKRTTSVQVQATPFYKIGKEGFAIREIDYGSSEDSKIVAALQDVQGKTEVQVATLNQTTSIVGNSEITPGKTFDLTSQISPPARHVAVNSQGGIIVVSNDAGEIYYFVKDGDDLKLTQQFTPYEDLANRRVHMMRFLLGGVSLVLSNDQGVNRIFSLYQRQGGDIRLFGRIHDLPSLGETPGFYSVSIRNKGYLIGGKSTVSLRFSTTESVRWQKTLPFHPAIGILGGKYNTILLLDTANRLHLYHLDDPHPEASAKSLFGKVWYEGSSSPGYIWQSTGATDDFEPKMSMVPLIIGTLKGTFYAMIFAVPLALLAALYASQFLHPNYRVYVKPTMEIMASLPSVVLGFLAALWLAPILETRVPSVILAFIFLPLSAFLFGGIWNSLPIQIRVKIKPGFEWIVFLPIMFAVVYLAAVLGPYLERIFFIATDPSTGAKVADFRLWWPQVTSLPFEQRNSLVVGFMMGFAVIPIIFTIADDALSNVPGALRSGSLALGASRWQTALRIVVPTASAGIFSAIMIGLGRAVGETMIVVMATGNTPILDMNIFSGMRTLSANLAVELPEAPYHSTLYRNLFLGAMVLFMLTFIVNTMAEVLRQHLREKYKTV